MSPVSTSIQVPLLPRVSYATAVSCGDKATPAPTYWQRIAVVLAQLWTVVATGAVTGLMMFTSTLVLLSLMPQKFIQLGVDVEAAKRYSQFLTFNNIVLKAPVIEEIIFRGVLQPAMTSILSHVLAPYKVRVWNEHTLPLANVISAVAIGAFFGAVHIYNRIGIGQVIGASVGGLILGFLREHKGLGSCVVAHMVNNAIAYSFICVISKA